MPVKKAPQAFRTISEVSDWLDTPTHVLRFWESKFKQVKPVKRAGGRRYYRPNDMLLLGGIKHLLHTDGNTIKAVQKLISSEGVKHVHSYSRDLDFPEPQGRKPRRKSAPPKAKTAETTKPSKSSNAKTTTYSIERKTPSDTATASGASNTEAHDLLARLRAVRERMKDSLDQLERME